MSDRIGLLIPRANARSQRHARFYFQFRTLFEVRLCNLPLSAVRRLLNVILIGLFGERLYARLAKRPAD